MSFFRYAGGKSKLRELIIQRLVDIGKPCCLEYREPFFGGGSVGLNYFRHRDKYGKLFVSRPNFSRLWINDRDYGISCLWTSVIKYPQELCAKVRAFTPSVEAFYDIKNELLSLVHASEDVVDIGFRKLAIHQISYSGLGTMSGGPLGGASQQSKYGIGCRWSPEYICKQIMKIHYEFSHLTVHSEKCTDYDFQDLITDTSVPALLYLDPPYYVKGNVLYQEKFSCEDHTRLATLLHETKHCWLLSYDDCPEIRELYKWAHLESVDVNYSITAAKKDGKSVSRTKPELLIWRPL